MYVTCDVCGEEIEIINMSYSQADYDEPEDFDFDFAEEHPCQDNWTDKQQEDFDAKVYEAYHDDIHYPDESDVFDYGDLDKIQFE